MPGALDNLPTAERERILAKLAKLKALAECKTGNVNETATAAAAMTRLMLEYKIEMAEIGADDASAPSPIVTELALNKIRGRGFPKWQAHMLSVLAKVNDCVGFESFQASRSEYYVDICQLKILGRSEDIANTRATFHYCIYEIERLCYVWDPHARVARKNDFRTGAAQAIMKRALDERDAVIAEEKRRAAGSGVESRALAVLDQRFAEVRAAAQKIGLETVRSAERPRAAQAYNAGYAAGSAIDYRGAAGAPKGLPGSR